jgi:putative transposase
MIGSLFSFFLSLFKSHTQLHLEMLFLRKQLEIVTRTSPRLRLRRSDRFFIGLLTDIFDSWKDATWIVKPDTVIRWHREGFRLFWRWKGRSEAGRPKIPQTQIDMIKQMAADNPLWGAPRIHGEILKLGIDIHYCPTKDSKEVCKFFDN